MVATNQQKIVKQLHKYLPFLLVVLTIISVTQWLEIEITNTFLEWLIDFSIIGFFFRVSKTPISQSLDTTYNKWLRVYYIWLAICVFRGLLICLDLSNYWIWKQFFYGTISLLLPTAVYVFCDHSITQKVLAVWMKYALLLFLPIVPFLPVDAFHFYLGPIILLGCFLPLLPKKWMLIVLALLLVMIFGDWGARSQVIKASIVVCISLLVFFKRFINNKLLYIAHWLCYGLAILLLILGITGTFNIFQDLSKNNEGKVVREVVKDGVSYTEDASADTRTFIYIEVIESAIEHGYVLWGRTPARGNDSRAFGALFGEELKTGFYERHSNELVHTNIFTWLGLIGVILYSLLYMRASWLAVFRSKSYYIKLLGCFVAFRWMYGWVEDFNRFDIMNITLWMMIAMCCSIQFREMTDSEFETWIKGVFAKKKRVNAKNRFIV